MTETSNITGNTAPSPKINNHTLIARWGKLDILFSAREGWLGVPNAFLRFYDKLQPYALTPAEAIFVLQLMTYKWTEEAPFPSYGTLAKNMGVTTKTVRRYAKALEEKGYLKRTARIGSSNKFELQPLFDALAQALQRQSEVQNSVM
jgi:hypothetical protein